MKWHLVYFVQGFMHPLWWLQSPEIITCNSVLVPLAHAIISMLGRGGGVPSFGEVVDFALVEVDFDDPTTNVRGRRALAIAKPTPRGY